MTEHARYDSLTLPLQRWLPAQLQSEAALAFPENTSPAALDQLITYTADAGIQPFLWHRLQHAFARLDYPGALVEALRCRYFMERIHARLRKEELARVLAAFEQAQLRSLVLKGAALAYVLYPEPGLRTACDIDLLVEEDSLKQVEAVLLTLGYERASDYSFETAYRRVDGALSHQVDLHWRLSDSAYLSELFTFEELYEQSVPLPEIGSATARRLAPSVALLHACIHLAGHDEWDHLVWLLDIDLLTRSFSPAQFQDFVALALQRNCAELCYRSLRRTQEFFGTPMPEAELARLNRSGETSALLLHGRDDAYRNFAQLLLTYSWRQRLKLMKEDILFPPWEVIHPSYKTAGLNVAPLVYALRLLHMPFKLAAHYVRGWLG